MKTSTNVFRLAVLVACSLGATALVVPASAAGETITVSAKPGTSVSGYKSGTSNALSMQDFGNAAEVGKKCKNKKSIKTCKGKKKSGSRGR